MDAATAAELNAIKSQLHDIHALLHRLCVPAERLTTAEAARRARKDVRTIERWLARGFFTDCRPPDLRGTTSPRLIYADEFETYMADGVNGVKRLRQQLGRAP